MSQRKIAFLGPPGTHSEQACISYDPKADRLPFASISAVISAVVSKAANEAIVPIENSLEGSVTDTLDLLIHDSTLFIHNELVQPIKNFLMAAKGTQPVDIEVVYSHPQALAQCRRFLSNRFPNVQTVASMSTSAAVEDMLREGPRAVAIATERASVLYGATILEREIDDNPNNQTRFVILAYEDQFPTGDDKTSMCFSFDEDSPGILHSVLGEFATRGINMTKIESRPTKQNLGRYVFLIDILGHREDQIVKEALTRVQSSVSMFKVFGSYPRRNISY